MKVVLAGGSGLIGTALAWRLTADGHQVVILTRGTTGQAPAGSARRVVWTPDGSTGAWSSEIDGADAVVNFTGAGIADRRWSPQRKQELRTSRVLPTRSLVGAIRQASAKPAVFLQCSGAGFYGASKGDTELDESFPPGDDFLGQLCVAWEAEAHPVSALGCRLVIFRNGVVLARDGGIIARMRVPFRWFVGGPIASGQQYLSWIHRDDWVSLALFALTTPAVSGIVNATAPTPVTNTAFSQALGHALHRPSWLPIPGFALQLLYGELATAMLIRGQRVVPKHALDQGFQFSHPTIDEAMEDAVGLR
jgi:uncharacterized protein (TIGR01777 family)